jgi:hypothetical protein
LLVGRLDDRDEVVPALGPEELMDLEAALFVRGPVLSGPLDCVLASISTTGPRLTADSGTRPESGAGRPRSLAISGTGEGQATLPNMSRAI